MALENAIDGRLVHLPSKFFLQSLFDLIYYENSAAFLFRSKLAEKTGLFLKRHQLSAPAAAWKLRKSGYANIYKLLLCVPDRVYMPP